MDAARRTRGAGRVLTMVDAFSGTAALGPDGCAALVKALGGGRATIACAPLGDLHDRRRRRLLVEAVVSAMADDDVLVGLADTRLADLAPGASLLPDDELGAHQCGARLFNLLVRERASRWSTILRLRVADVRAWTDAGARTTAEIVGLAFERSLAGLASVRVETSPAGAAVDLAILLDHEQVGLWQPLFDALTELSRQGQPDVVRTAAERLLRTTPHAAGHVAVLSDILAAMGSGRDVDIFVKRTLTLAGRPTIDAVAKRFGLSAERVRQILGRAEARAQSAAAAAPESFRALVAAVRSWLGAVVPEDVVDDVAIRLGAGSAHTPTGGLLLWLAGPYLPVPGHVGWLALDPAGIVASTTGWLSADGGVRPADEVRAELAVEGVRVEHRDAWMASCGGIQIDDMVVHAVGGPATAAERVLFAAGRGMGAVEIAALIATEDRVGELHRVLRRDRRFVRVATDVYELAEWGGSPAPEAPEPVEAPVPGPTSIDGRWWLRVPVDADVLRGACRPVPVGLVDAVSLISSHRRSFTSRCGPVAIVHDGAVPACGPLRHVALACGAQSGDELWLGFDPAGDVSVRLVRGDDRAPAGDGPFADGRPVSLMAQGAR